MRKLPQNVLWMNSCTSQDLTADRLPDQSNRKYWAYPLATIHLFGRRRASRGKEFLQDTIIIKSANCLALVKNSLSANYFSPAYSLQKQRRKALNN